MLETFLITFREGLEAFLIVAIMISYLQKMEYYNLIKPVYCGVAAALFLSATTGWHVADLAQDPLWEGSLAMIAGVLVATFTIHIMRTAKTIRQDIGKSLEKRAQADGAMAEIGIFILTVVMVAREGMETALMLGAISAQNNPASMLTGALSGLIAIGAIAWLWSRHGHRVNLRAFLQVTGIFLVLFSINLFVYGLHELSEMAAIPLIGDNLNMQFHLLTEPVEEGPIANLITFGLIALPALWLLGSYLRGRISQRAEQVSAAE